MAKAPYVIENRALSEYSRESWMNEYNEGFLFSSSVLITKKPC